MQPQANNYYYPKPKRRYGSLIVLLIMLVAAAALLANRQNLIDWWRLRGYQAPAVVSQLAAQDTLTDYARKVFYVNQPEVNSKSDFSEACAAKGQTQEQTIVLGCYHGNQGGIFLLDVTDNRLNGVEQVTAAHEMLHGAYDRLSRTDKNKVDGLLLDYYHNQLHDQRVLSTIEAYKKSEPDDLVNEMHSIFGTEVANLPAPLEQYYKRYFANRSQVAGFAAQYQAAFTSRQAAIAAYDKELSQLKSQIGTTKEELSAQQTSIASSRNALVAKRNSGDIASYNAGVPAYNSQINDYNTKVETVRALISRYNNLVNERNAIAFEESQLVNALRSSDVAPINK